MYRLKKAEDSDGNDFWIITLDDIPEFYPSLFLKNQGHSSINTAKTYGYKLIPFYNFLYERKKRFWEADKNDVRDFIYTIINFDDTLIMKTTPNLFFQTISSYKSVIVKFYRFLSVFSDQQVIEINDYIYGKGLKSLTSYIKLSYEEADIIMKATMDLCLTEYKSSQKIYMKEYRSEEIAAILSNLRTIRNKAIFLLTLHGMRIDEVLSIHYKDYNSYEQTIIPSRSKGRGRGKKRTLVINDKAVQMIENYLLHERNIAEGKVQKGSEYLFVNLRIGDIDDELTPVQYQTFYNALGRASENAGLEGVRTHGGRSHRAVELLRYVRDENIEFTDEHWRIIMGWQNIESSQPYVDHENEKEGISLSRALHELQKELK